MTATREQVSARVRQLLRAGKSPAEVVAYAAFFGPTNGFLPGGKPKTQYGNDLETGNERSANGDEKVRTISGLDIPALLAWLKRKTEPSAQSCAADPENGQTYAYVGDDGGVYEYAKEQWQGPFKGEHGGTYFVRADDLRHENKFYSDHPPNTGKKKVPEEKGMAKNAQPTAPKKARLGQVKPHDINAELMKSEPLLAATAAHITKQHQKLGIDGEGVVQDALLKATTGFNPEQGDLMQRVNFFVQQGVENEIRKATSQKRTPAREESSEAGQPVEAPARSSPATRTPEDVDAADEQEALLRKREKEQLLEQHKAALNAKKEAKVKALAEQEAADHQDAVAKTHEDGKTTMQHVLALGSQGTDDPGTVVAMAAEYVPSVVSFLASRPGVTGEGIAKQAVAGGAPPTPEVSAFCQKMGRVVHESGVQQKLAHTVVEQGLHQIVQEGGQNMPGLTGVALKQAAQTAIPAAEAAGTKVGGIAVNKLHPKALRVTGPQMVVTALIAAAAYATYHSVRAGVRAAKEVGRQHAAGAAMDAQARDARAIHRDAVKHGVEVAMLKAGLIGGAADYLKNFTAPGLTGQLMGLWQEDGWSVTG